MKVKLTAVQDELGANWSLEIDVTPETKVKDLKVILEKPPHELVIKKNTKVLTKQATGMMYTMPDTATVKKEMVLVGASRLHPAPPRALDWKPSVQSGSPNASTTLNDVASSATPKTIAAVPPATAINASGSGRFQAPYLASSSPAQVAPAGAGTRPNLPKAVSVSAEATPSSSNSADLPSQVGVGKKDLVSRWLHQMQVIWPQTHNGRSGVEYSGGARRLPETEVLKLLKEMSSTIVLKRCQRDFIPIFLHVFLPQDIALKGNPKILRTGAAGLPVLFEAIMIMGDMLRKSLEHLVPKYGFAVGLQGYVDMWKAVEEHAARSDVSKLIASVFASLWFGGPEAREQDIEQAKRDKAIPDGIAATNIWPSLFLAHTHHLALPPLIRHAGSGPRAIALAHSLIQYWGTSDEIVVGDVWRLGSSRPLVVWLLGARDRYEGDLARSGHFHDVAGLLGGNTNDSSTRMEVYLIGDDITPAGFPVGKRVRVHVPPPFSLVGPPAHPNLIVHLHSGLGTLESSIVRKWLQGELTQIPRRERAPSTSPTFALFTNRSEREAIAERLLLRKFGYSHVFGPARNIFSGSAGDVHTQYDENGWITIMTCGPRKSDQSLSSAVSNVDELCASCREHVFSNGGMNRMLTTPASPGGPANSLASPASVDGNTEIPALEDLPQQKTAAVFFGILDLKYDPKSELIDRVKVLETGDGRNSRFSGYGAAILKDFKQEHKLEETLQRSILVENKKITHDFFSECGYDHILPKQAVFPKMYKSDLAKQVMSALSLPRGGIVVLKLCNRARGAGVVLLSTEELDEALQQLLVPPTNVDNWLRKSSSGFARSISWGCFEEQLRHWWSNECPCFIAEEFRQSMIVSKNGLDLDGTMRVGFSLHREDREDGEEMVMTENGPLSAVVPSKEIPEDDEDKLEFAKARALEAFWNQDSPHQSGCAKKNALKIQWLGGYWKLPEEGIDTHDLRGRCISKARQGTLPVDQTQLHEVYACIGDAVQRIFSIKEISPQQLIRRYNGLPEFGAFVAARLACSLRMRDSAKSQTVLGLAEAVNRKAQPGPARDQVDSYIFRNQGVFEVMSVRWDSAIRFFEKSLKVMPANSTTRFMQGMYHIEVRNWMNAVDCFEASLQLDPDFKAPYVNLGWCWLRLENWNNAIEACQAGLFRHPQTSHCFYNIGLASYCLATEEEGKMSRLRTTVSKWRGKAIEAFAGVHAHMDRKNNPWKEEDDDMLDNLNNVNRKLPPLQKVEGWKFFNWRP